MYATKLRNDCYTTLNPFLLALPLEHRAPCSESPHAPRRVAVTDLACSELWLLRNEMLGMRRFFCNLHIRMCFVRIPWLRSKETWGLLRRVLSRDSRESCKMQEQCGDGI